MTIVTITGKNHFAAAQKLADVKAEFIEEFGDSNLVELSAEEATFDDVMAGMAAQGLFSSSSLVILSELSRNKYLQEQITEKMDTLPDESELIIYEPQFDRRSAVFKKLKSESVFNDFAELDERQLVQWAAEKYKEMGGNLGYGEASLLAQRVNLDQWALFNELEKLSALDRPVTRELIEEVVDESFNETIFNLLDLAFSKQTDKAIAGYRKLRKNRVEPHYVLSMIVWQLHILLVSSYAGDRSPDQIASDHKLSPFVVKKSKGILTRTSRSELKAIVARASEIDVDSKTKSPYNIDAAVDLLIAQIAA